MNKLNRIGVVLAIVTIAVFGGASAAMATPTFDPSTEATGLFNTNWTVLIDVVKDMAPLVIGAGLVLTVINKVVGAFRKGKAPSRVAG